MAIDPVTLSLLVKAGTTAAKNPKVQKFASKGFLGAVPFGLSKLLGDDDDGLEDVRTEEQKQAAAALQSLGQTGSGAGITLGKAFEGPLGEFEQTSGEKQALGQLQSLFGSQNQQQAEGVFSQAANAKFNPDDPSSGFAAFSRALEKSGGQAQDKLNQQAAITGGVFGSGRGRDTASLQSDIQNQKGQFLTQLFQNQQQVALQGAQGLQDIETQKAQQSAQLQQQAAVERQLKDQQAKSALGEFKRQRSEELARIDLLQAEANRNPFLGVSSIPGSASGFSQLANSVLGEAGKSIGKDPSGFFDSFKGFLSKGGSSTTSPSISGSGSRLLNSAGKFNSDIGSSLGGF